MGTLVGAGVWFIGKTKGEHLYIPWKVWGWQTIECFFLRLNLAGKRQGCKDINGVAARVKVSLVKCQVEGGSGGAGASFPGRLWLHRYSGTLFLLSLFGFLPDSPIFPGLACPFIESLLCFLDPEVMSAICKLEQQQAEPLIATVKRALWDFSLCSLRRGFTPMRPSSCSSRCRLH